MSMDQEGLAQVLDPLRIFQGLTAKQEAYALARFNGASPTEAWKEVYDCAGSTARTIESNARWLERHAGVVARVHQLTAERNKVSSLSAHLSREFVVNGVMRIAMMGQKESTQLAAYALLGKTVGIDLFRETTRVERVDRTPADVDKDLKAKLQELMASMTIDGQVTDVTPVPAAAKPQPLEASARRDRRRKPAPK